MAYRTPDRSSTVERKPAVEDPLSRTPMSREFPVPAGVSRRDALRGGLAFRGLLVLGVAGCSTSAGSKNKSYSGQVGVSHLTSIVSSAPFLIAAQKGYYSAEGLNLRAIDFPGGGADSVRGVRSSTHIGSQATLETIIAFAKGATDLRIVGGLYNGAAVEYITKADTQIRSPGYLKGKRIAISQPDSITKFFADRLVRQAGLTPQEDVRALYIGVRPTAGPQ